MAGTTEMGPISMQQNSCPLSRNKSATTSRRLLDLRYLVRAPPPASTKISYSQETELRQPPSMAVTKNASTSACQSGQTAFAARLLEHFAKGSAATGSNLIFSPLSVHVALALMSAGASGDTLGEILAVAGAPSREELAALVEGDVVGRVLADRSADGGPRVAFACGAWTDCRRPLKPAYRDTVVQTFKGNASTVDFVNQPVESRKQINAWVAEVTGGLITELVNPYKHSETTVNVVVNAIYFKGEWRDPFKKENTVDREFHRIDGSSIDTAFVQSL
ncbi:unnamed protein product [Urochloa humidicola]